MAKKQDTVQTEANMLMALRIIVAVMASFLMTALLGALGAVMGAFLIVVVLISGMEKSSCVWRYQRDTQGNPHSMISCEKGEAAHYRVDPHTMGHQGGSFKYCINCGEPITIVDIPSTEPSIWR